MGRKWEYGLRGIKGYVCVCGAGKFGLRGNRWGMLWPSGLDLGLVERGSVAVCESSIHHLQRKLVLF